MNGRELPGRLLREEKCRANREFGSMLKKQLAGLSIQEFPVLYS